MNGDSQTLTRYIKELKLELQGKESNIKFILAPPHPYLFMAASLAPQWLSVAAQNCHNEAKGAYTGEVSAEMLLDLKVNWVILGHLERRHAPFNESSAFIRPKAKHALESGLHVYPLHWRGGRA